jgi:hypothetical protein
VFSKFSKWNNKNKNKNSNKKRSKNNKSPKLCLGDLIIRNGAKTISLQTLFGRLNNKKRNKNNKSPKLCLGDLIIRRRNGAKTISLQKLFGRLNKTTLGEKQSLSQDTSCKQFIFNRSIGLSKMNISIHNNSILI